MIVKFEKTIFEFLNILANAFLYLDEFDDGGDDNNDNSTSSSSIAIIIVVIFSASSLNEP